MLRVCPGPSNCYYRVATLTAKCPATGLAWRRWGGAVVLAVVLAVALALVLAVVLAVAPAVVLAGALADLALLRCYAPACTIQVVHPDPGLGDGFSKGTGAVIPHDQGHLSVPVHALPKGVTLVPVGRHTLQGITRSVLG